MKKTVCLLFAVALSLVVCAKEDTDQYIPQSPAFRGFLNVGDIHSCEPWLYSECLKKNIALRVREWRKKNKE